MRVETKGKSAKRKNQKVANVLLSGGVDSAACMKFLQSQGFAVRAIFIDYGQAAARLERAAAAKLAKLSRCPLKVIAVTGDSHFGSGELLGRNAFLIFTALLFLERDWGLLAIGLHSGTRYYGNS